VRVLVAYDVNTATAQGERRLRRVARACLDFGQRVQKSVFECTVTQAQLEALRRRLLAEVDLSVDSLRIYRLPEGLELDREVYGASQDVDFEGPLVL
jgi:CRISPR-associated protein Cas2